MSFELSFVIFYIRRLNFLRVLMYYRLVKLSFHDKLKIENSV